MTKLKKIRSLSCLLLVFVLLLSSLAACNNGSSDKSDTPGDTDAAVIEEKDYASSIKLDMNSETVKEEVSVKSFVDGDTTHFFIDESVSANGILKARYLAINTPESTGKVEEYGKKASEFTREKLSAATSIIIESDSASWNLDSTGDRYLVWVWYKTDDMTDYRNLNIEILQNGLAIASSSANNRYGEICIAAINQAKALKYHVYSGQKDPDFFYGDAIELTLKELRTNIDSYNGIKVAFEGVITKNNANCVYIEDYDSESDMYYGISVYYGYGLNGQGLDIISIGNRSRIVGTVQYYEAGGTYQVSGLSYRQMKPDDPNNIKKISSGHSASYRDISAEQFANGTVTLLVGEEMKEFSFASLAMNTTVAMDDLLVTDAYTTDDDSSSSYGAITLTCESEGYKVTVRTIPFYDESGALVTQDKYIGQTISVLGLVDLYSGEYQIKILNQKDITIK